MDRPEQSVFQKSFNLRLLASLDRITLILGKLTNMQFYSVEGKSESRAEIEAELKVVEDNIEIMKGLAKKT